MTLDVDDLALFDNVETVTINRKSPGGSTVTYSSVTALRRAISAPVGGSRVEADPDRATWHVKASTIAVRPARNDQLVDSYGDTWLVKSCAIESFGTRYRLDTIKMENIS